MKGIMFNEHYGLESAVLNGSKIRTCRDELTLITSNLKINGEPLIQRYGDRVSSRLNEMCNYFEIKGIDRRKI